MKKIHYNSPVILTFFFLSLAALIRAVERVTAEQVAQMAGRIKLDTVYRMTGKEDARHG